MPNTALNNAEYSSYLLRGDDHFAHPAAISFQGVPRIAKHLARCYRPVYLGLLFYAINPFLTIAIACYLATAGLVTMALVMNRKRDEQYSVMRVTLDETLPNSRKPRQVRLNRAFYRES